MSLKRDEFFANTEQILAHIRRMDDLEMKASAQQVRLRVDESVSPAMFKVDQLIPGGYVANSLTIRAVRPDIFIAGGIDNLSLERPCASCGKILDWQFWKLCPYCAHSQS